MKRRKWVVVVHVAVDATADVAQWSRNPRTQEARRIRVYQVNNDDGSWYKCNLTALDPAPQKSSSRLS